MRFLPSVPFNRPVERRHRAARIAVPACWRPPRGERQSTQEGFGRLLSDLARHHPELGRPSRHHVAGRDDFNQPRRLGEPPRRVRVIANHR